MKGNLAYLWHFPHVFLMLFSLLSDFMSSLPKFYFLVHLFSSLANFAFGRHAVEMVDKNESGPDGLDGLTNGLRKRHPSSQSQVCIRFSIRIIAKVRALGSFVFELSDLLTSKGRSSNTNSVFLFCLNLFNLIVRGWRQICYWKIIPCFKITLF